MSTVRDQHWRDDPHPDGGRKRQRVIRNWMHYRQPGGEWQDTSPRVDPAQGPPHDWSGAFEFSHASVAAPLQAFFRDASDTGNRALFGVRLSDRPNSWVNFKALDVAGGVDAIVAPDGLSVSWPGLWTDSTLVYRTGAHKVAKEIILASAAAPTVFRFTVKLPAQHDLTLTPDGGASICDGTGTEVLKIRAPYGYDSATTAPTPDGHQAIRVTLTEDLPVGAFRVLRLDVNEDDLAGAVWPVTVDPTVVISGTSAIEDANIRDNNVNANYGGATDWVIAQNYGSPVIKALVRALSTSLPEGAISSAKASFYGDHEGLVTSHAVLRAWGEGTANGSAQAGSCCWNYFQYSSAAWATGGCGGDGSDYESDASPPSQVLPAVTGGWVDVSLDPAWVERWKSGTLANNGWVINAFYFWKRPTEYTANPALIPYLTVVYTPAVTSRPYYYHLLNRRRRS